MFAPKVTKTQRVGAGSSTGKLVSQRRTLTARSVGRQEQDVARETMTALKAFRGIAWDLSRIPTYPPNLPRSPQTFTSAPSQLSRKSIAYEKQQPDPVSPAASDLMAPPTVNRVLASNSRPLDDGSRNRFAGSFGTDLDSVRVHTDSEAAESARAVRADAYTVGRHIVFGAGKYHPGTTSGDGLIAHELAHTAQQGRHEPLPGRLTIAKTDSVTEHEADRASSTALRGLMPTALTNCEPSLSRSPAQTDDQVSESKTSDKQDASGLSPDLKHAAERLRAGDNGKGPRIPITADLLSLFLPMAPRQPSLPSKFKDSPYTEIKGHAFIKGAADANEVDPNDVAQGQLGDCGLHAAMIAIARVNPQAIKDLITEKSDGTYDVTLYFKDHFWNNKTPHIINVKSTFPTDKGGNPLFSQPGDKGADGPELWAMLIEKAFAMHAGGYEEAEGIWDHDALNLLSTADAAEQSVTALPEADMGKAIKAKLTSGDYAITANTSESRWNEWTRSDAGEKEIKKLGIVMLHAYSIVAVDESAKTLDLRNPWGFQHLMGLPFDAFRKYFHTWSASKVK